jgi:hypothetical protein
VTQKFNDTWQRYNRAMCFGERRKITMCCRNFSKKQNDAEKARSPYQRPLGRTMLLGSPRTSPTLSATGEPCCARPTSSAKTGRARPTLFDYLGPPSAAAADLAQGLRGMAPTVDAGRQPQKASFGTILSDLQVLRYLYLLFIILICSC